MPHGGRRGRFWERFQRDSSEDMPPPPPPPPPSIRPPPPPHIRPPAPPHHRSALDHHHHWSFPTVTSPRRSRRGRNWISADGSPSRFGTTSARDIYMELDSKNVDGVSRNSSEICFICGDLLANHPEVPTIHLCENNDYAEVIDYTEEDHASILSTESGKYSQARVPLSRIQVPANEKEDINVAGDVNKRLVETQQTLDVLETQIGMLCQSLSANVCISQVQEDGDSIEDKEDKGNLTDSDKLVDDLEESLQGQYDKFIRQVKHHLRQKCAILDVESDRINKDKDILEKERDKLDRRSHELDLREQEINEMKKKVEGDRTKFVKEQDESKAELALEWKKLNDEKMQMEEMHKLQDSKVKLDVGGHNYTTSVSTITQDSNSLLAAMFSGRHEMKHDKDNTIFIDRDGTHFRYILNYLRDGVTDGSLPSEPHILMELLNEAEYYQIKGLVAIIEEKLKTTKSDKCESKASS